MACVLEVTVMLGFSTAQGTWERQVSLGLVHPEYIALIEESTSQNIKEKGRVLGVELLLLERYIEYL